MRKAQMKATRDKTFQAKAGEIEHKWHLLDADGKILGRLAARVATILQGKHKPTYTAHIDTGDFVVVINAEKVALSGKKRSQKVYRHYTGHVGGLREIPFEVMMKRHPERVVENAVRRMLPKTRLGRKMYKKLKVYAGPAHPHASQKPAPLEL